MKKIAFLLALFYSACVYSQTTTIQLQQVLTGLSSPLLVTNAHDGSNRIFIVEQTGKIKVVQPGATTATTFLDIGPKIVSGGEQGLLGLTFHPAFRTNHRFFVNYTRAGDGATVIAEYQASTGNRNVAGTAEKILLTIAQPYSNHNGGMIEFGPDGFLYVGMGDGGSGNDPQNNAQNIESLLGKFLRIDVDHTAGTLSYAIPADNPFAGAAAGRDEIFALGVRNPWRYSFDRLTGQLYAGDVGQGARETVKIIEQGKNYGWATWEGTRCNTEKPVGAPACTALPLIPPPAEYDHSNSRCSITGGYVYRGARQTFPLGTYLYGDYCTGEIWQLQNGQSSLLTDLTFSLVTFGEDEGGEIYITSIGSGIVYRLVNPNSPKSIATVSAASYNPEAVLAPDSIAATFGSGLANGTFAPSSLPLPTNLGGTTVTVRDSKGVERPAPLFYASPAQVNFLIPSGTAAGYGAVIVKINDTIVSSGAIKVDTFEPALFTMNADASGPAAALLQLIKNGQSTYSAMLAEIDPADSSGQRYRTVAIDLDQNYDQIYLLLYGSGFRGSGNPLTASANIGGLTLPVEFVGAQGFFTGVDQINIPLTKDLKGKGEVDLIVIVNGKASNPVRVKFK